MVSKVEEMKKYLAEKYGIKSEEQLKDELKKLPPINIGVFVTPLKGVAK